MEKACFEFNVHMFNFCAHTGSNTILLHYTSNYIYYNIYHIYNMPCTYLCCFFLLSMDGGLYGKYVRSTNWWCTPWRNTCRCMAKGKTKSSKVNTVFVCILWHWRGRNSWWDWWNCFRGRQYPSKHQLHHHFIATTI